VTVDRLNAGFGIATITPDRSLPLAGISGKRFGNQALDNLKVRAIAVTHADTTLVLVSVDVLYVSRTFCDQLGSWLGQNFGITGDNLLVAATHTHCAPLLFDRYFQDVLTDNEFTAHAMAGAQSAISTAIESQSEAVIEFSSSSANVSINRRAQRLDRVEMRRFRLRRSIANRPNPRGPVDNTVRTIRFRMRVPDHPDIVLISAGCHPSIIREDVYSADYPGLIEHHLNEINSRPAQVLFVQGFSGDSRPLLLATAPMAVWPPGRGFDWLFDRQKFRKNSLVSDANWVAATLAKSIAQAPVAPLAALRLSARRVEVSLALDETPDFDQLRGLAESESEPEWRQNYARFALAAYDEGAIVPIRVHRWSLGAALCIVGLEGEIFSEFSSWMDREYKDQGLNVVPAGCVGGMVGYIPTAADLAEGGYEIDRSRTMFGLPSRFAKSVEGALKNGIKEVFSDSLS